MNEIEILDSEQDEPIDPAEDYWRKVDSQFEDWKENLQ
jgi:hypothetical protein